MRDDDKRGKGKIIEIIKCRDDVTPSSHHVGSSRRYSEALFFSEIIKRTGLTKTTQREEHRWGIFYHKYTGNPSCRHSKKLKKKKRVQTTGKQLRGGGGEIEKIIVKNILGVATTSCKSSNELISNGLGSEIIFFHYYLALWRGYVMLIALFFSNGSLRLFFPPLPASIDSFWRTFNRSNFSSIIEHYVHIFVRGLKRFRM